MKKIGSILSLTVILSSCASAYPIKMHYVTDVTNQVCAEYEVTDLQNVKFRWVRDLPLVPKGKCDRAFGVSRDDANRLLNWIRDEIKNSNFRVDLSGFSDGGNLNESDSTLDPILDRLLREGSM